MVLLFQGSKTCSITLVRLTGTTLKSNHITKYIKSTLNKTEIRIISLNILKHKALSDKAMVVLIALFKNYSIGYNVADAILS